MNEQIRCTSNGHQPIHVFYCMQSPINPAVYLVYFVAHSREPPSSFFPSNLQTSTCDLSAWSSTSTLSSSTSSSSIVMASHCFQFVIFFFMFPFYLGLVYLANSRRGFGGGNSEEFFFFPYNRAPSNHYYLLYRWCWFHGYDLVVELKKRTPNYFNQKHNTNRWKPHSSLKIRPSHVLSERTHPISLTWKEM